MRIFRSDVVRRSCAELGARIYGFLRASLGLPVASRLSDQHFVKQLANDEDPLSDPDDGQATCLHFGIDGIWRQTEVRGRLRNVHQRSVYAGLHAFSLALRLLAFRSTVLLDKYAFIGQIGRGC